MRSKLTKHETIRLTGLLMVILYNSEQEVTWHSGLGISAQKKKNVH